MWDLDIEKLEALDKESATAGAGCITTVFTRTVKVMHPTLPPASKIDGYEMFVTITHLSKLLEGACHP